MARDASVVGRRLIRYWASPEPTIARIDGQTVRDQLAETGHDARADDVALLGSLGVAATRLPVLWERVAPIDPRERSFAWACDRAARLRTLGIEPIVTLLHHGSGPSYTDLLDDAFPELFAEYAEAAARALPFVRRFTPINEILTTARFSALYGVWYPNARDDASFGRALTNQVRAVQLAMRRIRRVTTDAELVTTEDLQGFVAGDAGVRDYVGFLHERRWLALDMLEGRVTARHPLHAYLRDRAQVSEATFAAMRADATPIAIAGFNHYAHSERYLFTRANGATGDVAAVHVRDTTDLRVAPLLRAAAERQPTLALSEVHIHAAAAERVAWLLEHDADARACGANVVAVGAWAAFGMIDWYSLLRRPDGIVEDGIFTYAGREGVPRETVVADAVRLLARGDRTAAEALAAPGWWRDPARFHDPEDLATWGDAEGAEGARVRPDNEVPA